MAKTQTARTEGFSRLVFRVAAKFMGRGFEALLALAEQRAASGTTTWAAGTGP
jgi:hypothetical protein